VSFAGTRFWSSMTFRTEAEYWKARNVFALPSPARVRKTRAVSPRERGRGGNLCQG
jgi:hypothetical protein